MRTDTAIRRPCLLLLAAGVLLIGLSATRADDPLPYPAGQSIQQLKGLKTVLVLPEALSQETPASLVVVLHGAGGTATGMAGSFTPWASDGYVVCAPKAQDMTWEPDDLRRVLEIAAHLKEVLPIDPARVHVVGYSNGGWNLHPLAFDADLRPCSATWIAAGYRGGQVPRWVADTLGACAMAGSEDANLRAARATVPALRGRVRNVEVHEQPGIGHTFPRKLMPYLQWWMGVQDGRVHPGDDRSFEWTEDLDAALAANEQVKKKGGVFLWAYTQDDAGSEVARQIQRDVFFDHEVRFLARQIPCVKLDAAVHAERLAELGVKSTPALLVLDRKGKVKKRFEEKIKTSKVARTLRGVAPNRAPPK